MLNAAWQSEAKKYFSLHDRFSDNEFLAGLVTKRQLKAFFLRPKLAILIYIKEYYANDVSEQYYKDLFLNDYEDTLKTNYDEYEIKDCFIEELTSLYKAGYSSIDAVSEILATANTFVGEPPAISTVMPLVIFVLFVILLFHIY